MLSRRQGLGEGGAPEAGHLEFEMPLPPGASSARPPRAILSLRRAGSMRYLVGERNPFRHAFFRSLGVDPARVVATELHHTRRLRLVSAGGRGRPAGGGEAAELDAADLPGRDSGDGGPDSAEGRDGILVEGGALPLVPAVTVADCMPIWIWDSASGAYGVLHSGWKGTGILPNAVRALAERHGSPASAISVVLGPAIGACCYEVPEERALRFAREFGEGSVDRSGPAPRLDIRAANLSLALNLGVGALLSVDACTSCDPALGSYRREGAIDFTRMVALCLPRS